MAAAAARTSVISSSASHTTPAQFIVSWPTRGAHAWSVAAAAATWAVAAGKSAAKCRVQVAMMASASSPSPCSMSAAAACLPASAARLTRTTIASSASARRVRSAGRPSISSPARHHSPRMRSTCSVPGRIIGRPHPTQPVPHGSAPPPRHREFRSMPRRCRPVAQSHRSATADRPAHRPI